MVSTLPSKFCHENLGGTGKVKVSICKKVELV